jgi:hypothetical protein
VPFSSVPNANIPERQVAGASSSPNTNAPDEAGFAQVFGTKKGHLLIIRFGMILANKVTGEQWFGTDLRKTAKDSACITFKASVTTCCRRAKLHYSTK